VVNIGVIGHRQVSGLAFWFCFRAFRASCLFEYNQNVFSVGWWKSRWLYPQVCDAETALEPMPMSNKTRYDVFLGHSVKDKPVMRALAERLMKDGLDIWFDEWEIEPGAPSASATDEGLERSRTLVLAMSVNAFTSEWEELERHTWIFRDPANTRRRFIPLRLDDVEILDTLKQFAYIDWRQKSEADYAKLLAACRPPAVLSVPVEGVILRGHEGEITSVTVTPDGRVVSGSVDKSLRLWDLETSRCLRAFQGHTDHVLGVAVTLDGEQALSASADHTVRLWELATGCCLNTFQGHVGEVWCVAVTRDGRRVVSGSSDNSVRLWDLETGHCLATFEGHTDTVRSVVVTPDCRRLVSASTDKSVRVWDLEAVRCIRVFEDQTGRFASVVVTPDGRRVVSGSSDNTVRLWDLETGHCLATFEGHTDAVRSVVVTPDGQRLVSGSRDNTVRLWNLETRGGMATFKGHTDTVWSVAVTPDGQRIVSGSGDSTMRVWKVPPLPTAVDGDQESTKYTNAKVLLVGDSGVGKTGLANRLTKDRFESSISSDAVWASQLRLPHDTKPGDVDREIWLWDFAGQAGYRLVHQLFMDETALAVLVFNPQSDNPFEGLGQWDRDLHRAARRRYQKLLVAARCDRGTLAVSRKSVEMFCKERSFATYLETSAFTGAGCGELRQAIIDQIDWNNIPWTASPRIFKLLKEQILQLRDEGKVLLRLGELKQQLEVRLPKERFTLEELQAVVGLLAGPGMVWRMEFGDFILLKPELINSYAFSVVQTVCAHAEEIGCIAEEQVLKGNLDFANMQIPGEDGNEPRTKRLLKQEEDIVLRAMHQTLVDHALCLREHTSQGPQLVFPSFFKRDRPELPDKPITFVTYSFAGPLDEIYATLIVRLHYTAPFEKVQLWRYAAAFKTNEGKRVGIKMIKSGEGSAVIHVHFEKEVPDDTKVTFIRYVHEQGVITVAS
jgi:WD40 repeat protein/GTPase SAR1 family protein